MHVESRRRRQQKTKCMDEAELSIKRAWKKKDLLTASTDCATS